MPMKVYKDKGKVLLVDPQLRKSPINILLGANLKLQLRKKVLNDGRERIDLQVKPFNKGASCWESHSRHSYRTGDIRYVFEKVN